LICLLWGPGFYSCLDLSPLRSSVQFQFGSVSSEVLGSVPVWICLLWVPGFNSCLDLSPLRTWVQFLFGSVSSEILSSIPVWICLLWVPGFNSCLDLCLMKQYIGWLSAKFSSPTSQCKKNHKLLSIWWLFSVPVWLTSKAVASEESSDFCISCIVWDM
jgi:hypothetical protein